jgi:class 3 adenylate cyclase
MAGGVACVLFTDLVGSTELMARLGDAAFDAVRAEHFACLREALTKAGGAEVKSTGDGLMATFASAVDALAGAVAAQRATERHARDAELPLSIRVGLALGEVGVENGDVFGTPVVEAARLVAAARPGQILCAALLRTVAGSRTGVSVTDLGSVQLKGLPEPVAVCEVDWEPETIGAPSLPLPPLLAGPGRIFVGRDVELERIRRLWKEVAADGGRRLVLLGGEPGIGKTRLATELARSVHADGAVVLAGRCDEDLGVPYQPFVEALRHYAVHTTGERRLGRHAGELVRLTPELAELVPGLPEPLRSDPETERYRLFDAMAGWLADVSAAAPVLLVLDDLHWAAKPTILLLRHVLRAPEPARLLVAVTYRDTDIGRGHPLTEFLADLRREGGGERFSLVGLDREGVGAFIEAAAGHALADEEGEGYVRAVWEETEGNPFFVAEVIRHLTETEAIEQRDGRWVMTAPVEELGIPEGVRDVVGRRISRLPEGADRVLGVAAVVGLEFEPGVVGPAGGFEEDELFAALEAAASARLLVEVPGGTRYRFAHALVRATLYDEISGPRRVVLHRRVAETIETVHRHRLDDHLPALAHHWSRASAPTADVGRAVDYAARAGHRALAQLAHDEAAAYYVQALELLDAGGAPPDDRRRQELLIARGQAQQRSGDPGHRETLLAAGRLAESRGDTDAMAQAALANLRTVYFSSARGADAERVAALEAALAAQPTGDSDTRARLLGALALERFWDRDRTRRHQLSDEAVAMARQLGNPATLAYVLAARPFAIGSPDTVEERLAITAELVGLAERLGDPALICRARANRFRVLTEVADVEPAERALEAFSQAAHDVGQPTMRWTAGLGRVARSILHGRVADAERESRETFELGLASGQPDAQVFWVLQQLFIRLEQGRLAEVEAAVVEQFETLPNLPAWGGLMAWMYAELDRMEDVRRVVSPVMAAGFDLPFDTTWLFGVTALAVACAAIDERDAVVLLQARLAPYRAHLATSGWGLTIGSVAHTMGLIAAVLGRFDEAEAEFRTAQAVHERIGAPAWLARTRLGWAAALLRRRGPVDHQRAGDLVNQALAASMELGLADVERRARNLLLEADR